MGAVPALSLRPSFWAPTALRGPHALHTDHLPACRKGATHSAQQGSLYRAHPSRTEETRSRKHPCLDQGPWGGGEGSPVEQPGTGPTNG